MKRLVGTAVVFGVLTLMSLPVSAQEIFEEEDGVFSTRELRLSTTARAGDKVTIKSALTLHGKLTITVTDREEAEVVYLKKAKTDRRSRGIDFIDLIAVVLEPIPGGVRLELRAPNPAPWGDTETGIVEAELAVPELCEVEIEAPYFDIEADGPFKRFLVPSSLGRLDVANVTEKLDLATSNRRVSVRDIAGEVRVVTSNSTLRARDINCPTYRAVFRNDGGDIRIDGLSGELNVKNSYGRIDVEDYRPMGRKNYVRGFYGPIMLAITEMVSGRLIVSNHYEDIEITVPEDISAVLSLAVEEEGKIEVADFPFRTDLVQHNRLNLIAGDGASLISTSIRGKGNIFIRAIGGGE